MADEEVVMSNGILLILVLLFLSLVGGYLLKSRKCEFLQEAGLTVLIGILCGAVLEELGEDRVLQPVTRLNVEFFLLFLLPPIIFESGYNLDKRPFFQNIGASLLYAFLGTLLSAVFVTVAIWTAGETLTFLESASFAVLISSTDTVAVLSLLKDVNADELLYNFLLGESIFNDAVVISLYRTIILLDEEGESVGLLTEALGRFLLIFICSALVGMFVAFIVSFVSARQILKKVGSTNLPMRQNLEASSVIFGPWISYLISEALSQSGIVSILICGIFMAHYTRPNLSPGTQAVVGKAYSFVSHAAENLVFIFLGMGLFSFRLPFKEMGVGLCALAIVAIVVGRLLNIVVCSSIINHFRKQGKVKWSVQVLMWFAGPRGAIPFALAVSSLHDFRHGEIILCLTLIFAIGSILVIGVSVAPLIRQLNCQRQQEDVREFDDKEECGGRAKRWLAWLDESYLHPFFVDPKSNMLEAPESPQS